MEDLYNWVNPKTRKHSPMISKETYDIIKENADVSSCYGFYIYFLRRKTLVWDTWPTKRVNNKIVN